VRNVQDLSAEEREKILQEANLRCYGEIAEELDIPVGTIKRVIRTHNGRMKRYQYSDNYPTQNKPLRTESHKKEALRGIR